MIQSVINSMSIYAMGTIIIPRKVIKKLTAITRNFFWGGKHDKRSLAYVAWSTITTPKRDGGFGTAESGGDEQGFGVEKCLEASSRRSGTMGNGDGG